MKSRIFILLFLLSLAVSAGIVFAQSAPAPGQAAAAPAAPAAAAPAAAASAEQPPSAFGTRSDKETDEGYAQPTYRETVQTLVLLGGLDINDNRVADCYMRLVYPELYKRSYHDDVEWNNARNALIQRINEKKEYFRIFYEITSTFKLERYNFKTHSFPIAESTAIKNVDNLQMFTDEALQAASTQASHLPFPYFFPPSFFVELSQPLTVDRIPAAEDKVENIIARIEEGGNFKRNVYGRIRIHVTDSLGVINIHGNDFSELKGEVTSIDFFIDQEMTKPIGGVKIVRQPG